MDKKRRPQIVVISDLHLSTYGCQSKAILNYLNSVEPEILILNGDIFDIWQFSKSYFPASHFKVVKKILSFIEKGTETYYVTGNHDEMIRRFEDFRLGSFHVVNKVLLEIDGKKAWIFHGDVFDISMRHSKWLAKMGANGYAFLILLNKIVNFFLSIIGKQRISLSKKIKHSVKNAIKSKNDFELTAAEIAVNKGYDYVICGHIHQPVIKKFSLQDGEVTYLNSGDWIDHKTALEYENGEWKIYKYDEDPMMANIKEQKESKEKEESYNTILNKMRNDFEL
ncbi:UDP-2,3-diacylglucosamine diphosphatase [Aureibacter tunicatorum]|uniref:UDP-2,3-diacylglucosamine pyrophosphatase LpxH n=1 Tax=Aureibacter tunicatorum TaxID=866807 RepID=A0AAE3XSC2_9BACT|nr:UDP-2,3-diacylglucosamine diphosphatase [Aureibacter tunicatorum]MDR6241640.1 UDP-2,3-diacylglucosamine pyrophosphatase LpxH [Aureibacter tunicatorum]